MRVRQFCSLESADRWLLVRSACVLVAMGLGLRVLPVRRLQALAAGGVPTRRALSSARRHSVDRIAWAIRAASRYVPVATCLPQALTAQWMLARHGHPARLRIGMALGADGRVGGHAWVESADGVVIGGVDERHAPLEAVVRETR